MDLTLGVALLAGLISFLSPCVLPVVPAYLGQLGAVVARTGGAAVVATGVAVSGSVAGATLAGATPGAGPSAGSTNAAQIASPRHSWVDAHGLQALPNAIAFVVGFGTVFTLLGLTLSAALSPLREYLPLIQKIGGILLIILGLNLMGVLRLRRLAGSWRPLDRLVSFRPAGPRQGVMGGLVLGAVFAVGWTPCIGPTLGAILTMAAVGAPTQAAALLIAYSLGLGIPFLVLAVAAEKTPAITRPLVRHGHTIEVIGGALVVLMGLAILFDWLSMFSSAFIQFSPQV
jgi:cytochrome c-type biogenesis protein